MSSLGTELDRVKAAVLESDFITTGEFRGAYLPLADNYRDGTLPSDKVTVRLRFDWESQEGGIESTEQDLDPMFGAIGDDLFDVLVNGDVTNRTDPVLKVMNGSRVRGKRWTDVQLISNHLYRQFLIRKDLFEYQFFTVMCVTFE